ncbi:Frigida-like protein [Corchorus olitorius]|uniref:FRIGIDA-like protein n=1 Tax=Corchorus olitorius TaxID=93759 RepID=A0A1R3GB33_9ROSI|nr:Frigida-like protein [Corchorus olitorius]
MAEERKVSLRRTFEEVQSRASSILLLNHQWKDLENTLDSAWSYVEERLKEVNAKEEEMKQQASKIEEEIETRERLIIQRFEEIRAKEEELERKCTDSELVKKGYDESLKQNQVEELKQRVELGLKGDFEKFCQDFELEKKDFEERRKKLEFSLKQCEQQFRKYEQQCIELKSTEKLVLDKQIEVLSKELSRKSQIEFNGKDLQIFVNEKWENHESLSGEVLVILRLALDPAKFVLDAVEGFYPPYLKKGETEFDGDVVKRSCILLLVQLREICPEIKHDVKKEAMKIAFNWCTNLHVNSGNLLESLGFMLLLASFGLASAFDVNVLLNFFEKINLHDQAAKLFRDLYADKISGFIQNLISRKQYFRAIRYICAFEVVNEYPPVPILEHFLKQSKAENRMKKKRPHEKYEAAIRRLSDMKAVVKCIEDHKLELKFSLVKLKDLKNQIASLEKEYVMKNPASPTGCKCLDVATVLPYSPLSSAPSSITAVGSIITTATVPALASKTSSPMQSGCKHQGTIGSAEGVSDAMIVTASSVSGLQMPDQQPTSFTNQDSQLDCMETSSSVGPQHCPNYSSNDVKGESLRLLFEKQNDEDLVHIGISAALRSVADPAQFVLETINGCWHSSLEGTSYELAAAFKADELLVLLDSDYWYQKAPDLCQILGLTTAIPGKAPPSQVPILSITGRINAARDILRCIANYNLESKYPSRGLIEYIAQLEKSKAELESNYTAQLEKSKAEKLHQAGGSKVKTAPTLNEDQQRRENKRPRTSITREVFPHAPPDVIFPIHPMQPYPLLSLRSIMVEGIPYMSRNTMDNNISPWYIVYH